MAEVHTIDIDGEQWNILDKEAKAKNNEQDTEITNLTSDIDLIKNSYGRFYYDANINHTIVQNRIEAMIYCYNHSKSGIATIRYAGGFYNNVILPSAELRLSPVFVEFGNDGVITLFTIKSSTEYAILKTL